MKKNIKKIITFALVITAFIPFVTAHAKEITVNFDTDGGTEIPSVVLDGESLVGARKIPENPTKEGYTFAGWYPSKDFIDYQKFQEYSFHEIYDEDTTLYARFVSNDKVISNVNINVEAPKAGVEVTVTVDTSQGAVFEKQSDVPTATVADNNVHYEISFTAWVKGNCGSNGSCDERFEGTFVEGNDYFADITINVEEGYLLSDNLVIKVNGEDPYSKFNENRGDWTFFTAKVKAVKDNTANVKVEAEDNITENSGAKEEATKLIISIAKGEEVQGIDEELTTKIENAINSGKTIVIDVTNAKVDKTEVATDAEKVDSKLNSNENVGAYFDIDLAVKVDDIVLGNITELNDKITVSVDIPDNLPKIPVGYTRKYKIIRVHNGVAETLDVTVTGQKASFETDRFSTYALVYEDVKNINPQTGDSIILYIIMFGLSIMGLTKIVNYNKKKNFN